MAFVDFVRRAADSDIWYSFKSSHVVVVATVVTLFIFAMAFLAPILAPHTPFDPATLSLSDALKPPVLTGEEGADWAFPLGTDEQGRDVLSSIMYGTRLSLVVGILATIFSMVMGIALGLISGYVGGAVDAFIMRLADVQLTFPALLVALLIDGVVRGLISVQRHDEIAIYVIIGAIGLSFWVQYARTVRGSVLVEKSKEYVQAARVIGLSPVLIMIRHVLPNVMGPVLVIATINIGLAVLTEATLSFLGVGLPSTQPSLGTLIRLGQEVLLSGTWWIVIFPGITLAILVVAVNLMGDWLRDALNPKLR